ncbi:MAG: histidine triad nucleotide-binding protein [Clostridia bacterium]|nr:histidine triad nucleotide-binding protein [Clostridia bacterium]
MENCLFCKIAAGEIPSNKAYEDETVLAFHDIAPQAPVHVLIIPKTHIQSADALTEANDALIAHMFAVARKLAEQLGVKESGYRLITNIGPDAGQSVPHLHLHLIGGKELSWNN